MEDKKNLSRRKFCKAVPCTAAGVLASATLVGSTLINEDSKKSMKPIAKDIKVKVISQKGNCDSGHKVGDVVTITQDGVEGKICIHALYSFMPKVFAMMFDAQFSWLKNPDVSTSACPDGYNPVIFEISRKK